MPSTKYFKWPTNYKWCCIGGIWEVLNCAPLHGVAFRENYEAISYVLLRNIYIYICTVLILSSYFLFGRPNLNISKRFPPHNFCIHFSCRFPTPPSVHHSATVWLLLMVNTVKFCAYFSHTFKKPVIVHYNKQWHCFFFIVTPCMMSSYSIITPTTAHI